MSDDIKYFYLRDPKIKSRGGEKRLATDRVLTVARKLGKNGNKVHYQVSLCTPVMKWMPDGAVVTPRGDMYSKALGREIAVGRLKSKPFKASIADSDGVDGSPFRAVLESISTNTAIPHTARKMVKDYLKGFAYKSYVVSTETVDGSKKEVKPLMIEVWENDGKSKRTIEAPSLEDNLRQPSHTIVKGEGKPSNVPVPADRVAF
ncbi:MAG: hypothetical protein WC761_02105 [Candidatus Paceibacterota bacterium]|jgi:hypothetical protein